MGRGGKAVDARLSELSVMNKPRCLRDEADESGCMCEILSSPPPPEDPRAALSHFPGSDAAASHRCFTFVTHLLCIRCVCVCVNLECSTTPHVLLSSCLMRSVKPCSWGGAAISLMSSFLPFTCSSVEM